MSDNTIGFFFDSDPVAHQLETYDAEPIMIYHCGRCHVALDKEKLVSHTQVRCPKGHLNNIVKVAWQGQVQ